MVHNNENKLCTQNDTSFIVGGLVIVLVLTVLTIANFFSFTEFLMTLHRAVEAYGML